MSPESRRGRREIYSNNQIISICSAVIRLENDRKRIPRLQSKLIQKKFSLINHIDAMSKIIILLIIIIWSPRSSRRRSRRRRKREEEVERLWRSVWSVLNSNRSVDNGGAKSHHIVLFHLASRTRTIGISLIFSTSSIFSFLSLSPRSPFWLRSFLVNKRLVLLSFLLSDRSSWLAIERAINVPNQLVKYLCTCRLNKI